MSEIKGMFFRMNFLSFFELGLKIAPGSSLIYYLDHPKILTRKTKIKTKQKIGDDLGAGVLNLLFGIRILPGLVTTMVT